LSSSKEKIAAIGILAALLFFIVLYFIFPPFAAQINNATSILSRADIVGMRTYLLSFGIWAPIVSMGLMVLQSLAFPLPAFVITFANAWIFGWVMGAIYSWTGAMIGAAVCYFIAKAFGRPAVERFVSKRALEATDKFFDRYGKHSIMIARLLPIIPFDVISYAAGLTTMGFWGFFWATGIGQFPATIVYSWLGENMTSGAKYALWAACGFLILLVFSLAIKKRFDQKLSEDKSVKEKIQR
jgi:uncharacterized membrane protein YdjX (TVP38/TMEM64 family)